MQQEFVRQLPNAGQLSPSKPGAKYIMHLDFPLLLLLLAITAYGLLILYSAAGRQPEPVLSQGVKIGIGIAAMLVLAQISPTTYRRLAPWAFGVGLLLLVLVHFFGVQVKGSQRWLGVAGLFTFQPSELMKLMLPMALAAYFNDRQLPPKPRYVFYCLLMIAAPALLIASQPDLGTSLIIAASGLMVLLLTGISWKFVLGAGALGILAAPGFWLLLRDYQRQRILTLLDPASDPLGAGWNIMQSQTAIGSGGVYGKGLFQGTQSHLDFLPESRTDFIIAVLGEELGFLGVLLLLAFYLLLVTRGLQICAQAQDTFGRLLGGSITFTFFFYVFVNIGMVSGILPVVGVPLPLVSFGGTSMLTLFAGFGLLMSIHTHRRISL